MRALLIDLDGTLTDPREGIVGSLRHALEALGRVAPSDAQLASLIGPPLTDAFRELLGRDGGNTALVDEAIRHYRVRFSDRGWRENRVYAGVPELLRGARERGWRCLVATSKPTVFAERIALHFGLRPLLDGVYGSELDGGRTRKPELIAHLLSEERLAPEQALMVGDRRHDVEGAAAHGIDTIGVTYGFGSREELERAGARWLCDDPAAVLASALSAFASGHTP